MTNAIDPAKKIGHVPNINVEGQVPFNGSSARTTFAPIRTLPETRTGAPSRRHHFSRRPSLLKSLWSLTSIASNAPHASPSQREKV